MQGCVCLCMIAFVCLNVFSYMPENVKNFLTGLWHVKGRVTVYNFK